MAIKRRLGGNPLFILAFAFCSLAPVLPAHGRIKRQREKERNHRWQMSPKYALRRVSVCMAPSGVRTDIQQWETLEEAWNRGCPSKCKAFQISAARCPCFKRLSLSKVRAPENTVGIPYVRVWLPHRMDSKGTAGS